jgi:hypothetical protein
MFFHIIIKNIKYIYNYLLNLVPKPTVSLLAEYVFLDDVERKKFVSSKLEYVIESFQENIFDVNNLPLFDGEISIDSDEIETARMFLRKSKDLHTIFKNGKLYQG